MRIYVDFNAQLAPGMVNLMRMGTLRDLNAARIRLQEGMRLTLRSDSDIETDLEVEAIVRWLAEFGVVGGGTWVAEFDSRQLREVPAVQDEPVTSSFPCSGCGQNLASLICRGGLSERTTCPTCGTKVHAPIAPPQEA